MKRLLFLFLLWPVVVLAADANGSQVSCTTGAATTVGTATGRMSLCAYNGDATNPVYVNQAGSTAGYIIPAGQGRCFDSRSQDSGGFSSEIPQKCRSTGGTVTLYIWEAWR